ncbi:hypothetical protein Aconfl_29230 [Algoriphagus confluentis]|uniref:Uncharacterized protein n=2 Tax=Algoriphagus confluentis TaxID=1697556 RepID=A0ABQ6PSR7_9BACT|nr:hypothetical protein Aconfl_29230 [Algoriphagus confluentis]
MVMGRNSSWVNDFLAFGLDLCIQKNWKTQFGKALIMDCVLDIASPLQSDVEERVKSDASKNKQARSYFSGL